MKILKGPNWPCDGKKMERMTKIVIFTRMKRILEKSRKDGKILKYVERGMCPSHAYITIYISG